MQASGRAGRVGVPQKCRAIAPAASHPGLQDAALRRGLAMQAARATVAPGRSHAITGLPRSPETSHHTQHERRQNHRSNDDDAGLPSSGGPCHERDSSVASKRRNSGEMKGRALRKAPMTTSHTMQSDREPGACLKISSSNAMCDVLGVSHAVDVVYPR